MYKKSLLRVLLLLIRPIVVFSPFSSPARPSPFSITRFYILFEQTKLFSRASLLALAKPIYASYVDILKDILKVMIKSSASMFEINFCNLEGVKMISNICFLGLQLRCNQNDILDHRSSTVRSIIKL